MAKKIKTDLRNCPFCGVMLSWQMTTDITFNNLVYFKCKNCGGEISINKNSSLKPDNLFAPHNVFTVVNVGGYNYSKCKPTENLTVIEMQKRARIANDEIKKIKMKKEAVLKGLINEDGEIIGTPQSVTRKKQGRIEFFVGLILLGLTILMLWYMFK